MSSEETVRFQFNFRGVQVEISGERRFVDEMYQELMRDIEAARLGASERKDELKLPDDEGLVWVHRCSSMMRKIYMATTDDIGFTLLSNALDARQLSSIYVDKQVFDRFMPNIAKDRTLWAELTEEGRRTINSASE
ncbi:hypothetical protein FIV42_25575 [Persicimonas caeni]|uniref:Uncharacterized protein n=1 Tax=Persicimonas caeni TaxID=2292766 RepID=A0A4Y6Q177_PERCE|nr:hypothetical protein [Persicimonas caeni]QDG53987.1 hypothetical protein FIV42_25575 [Persicimonas caeni]QED35208.1 hypothetical protein FRD00_25570 [Persicimonas caeni]